MTHPYYSASKVNKLAFSMEQFTQNLPMFARVEAMDMPACHARLNELSSGADSEHLLEMDAISAKLNGEASVSVLPVYRISTDENKDLVVATLSYPASQPLESPPEDLKVVGSYRKGKPIAYLTMADLLSEKIVTPSGELLERKGVPTEGRLKSLANKRYKFMVT